MEYISKEHLEIRKLCKLYKIHDFKINDDGSIDTKYSVDLSNRDLDEIPIKFNKVRGYFDCSNNNIKSLKNSPKIMEGHFICSSNNITNLIHSPLYISGLFQCSNNPLESLEGYNGSMDNLHYHGKEKFIRKEKFKKILDDRY